MKYSVYLRPLKIEDAQISYQWRNNPKIWRFTGYRPDRYITPELEAEWMANVLKRENEKRFAICLTSDDRYIGNIFLTDITATEAQLHIFIGDIKYWGGGRAYDATKQIIEYAFNDLRLQHIYLFTNKDNKAALAAAMRLGWVFSEELGNNLVKNVFTREMFENGLHQAYIHKSEFVKEAC